MPMSRQQGLDIANKYKVSDLASGKTHPAHSSTNISQVLLNVESTFEIRIVLMTKIEPLTKQEHRWRK